MKFSRVLLPLIIIIFTSILLVEAFPDDVVSIDTLTPHSMQITFQSGNWSVEDEIVEMPNLGTDKSRQPSHTVLLGVPTSDVEWRLISAESTPLHLTLPPDTPNLIAADADHFLRDQPVASVTFNPVQPDGDNARVYTKIVVELSWDSDTKLEQLPNHPAYEELLAKTLQNYDSLDRPVPQTARPSQINRSTATTPTLRISVNQTGLHRLSIADLSAAGLPTDDLTQLRLTNRGEQVATMIAGDSLLFFGERYEDLYTDENVYWLTVGAGMQMEMVSESHPTAMTASQFATTHHLEENTLYWNTMLNGEGQDHWFWGERISPNTSGLEPQRSFTLSLPTIAPTPTVTLRVQLKGYTTLAHKTRIFLNGNLVDDQNWEGDIVFTHTVPVTGSLLIGGENVITVESADSGEIVDQTYINWIEIDHDLTYTAIDNALHFTPPTTGTYAFTVTNFSTETLYLLDVTNPRRPRQVSHTVSNGSLHFQQAVTSETRFFATANTAVPQITPDAVSGWKDGGNSADWIIITHANFITPAQRLADHRTAQGMQVAVVDIQDVYDEFGDGLFNPEAIRDFLAYTHASWQAPAPTYAVLLGDGSQDYKDQLNSGSRNFVPPRMIETFDRGQIPSDHWYVTFAGDDVFEEMFVGRLSAETLPQANAIVDNIIAYETRPTPAQQLALFVADDKEAVFETNSEQLIDRLPDLFDIERVYARTYTTPTVTRDITTTMLSGATFVNYMGHGNYYRWGSYRPAGYSNQRIFTEVHAEALENSEANPFVTVADCLNGFFSIPSNDIIDPYDEALAEALQRPANGGAVAVWTDAGFGYTSEQRILMNAFYDALFTDQITTLGSATNIAKTALYASSSYWQQNVRTMTLFGDPATALKIGETVPTSVALTATTAKPEALPLALTAVIIVLLTSSYLLFKSLGHRLQKSSA